MPASYVVGIDIGTGSVKAVASNFSGEVMSTAQEFYATSDHDLNQLNVTAVFETFYKCLKAVLDQQPNPPKAVAFSCAMHSILAVGKNNEPISNAFLWSDARSSSIALQLRHTEEGKQIYKATGTPIHAMSPLCKLAWLKETEPLIFNGAEKFISIKEYIWYQLFGEYAIDYSIASATGLFNIHTLQWEAAALKFAGICNEKLSIPVATNYSKTGVDSVFAERLNLPATTPFYIGASDGCLANLGSLCLDEHEATITIGTSAAVRLTSHSPIVDDERMIFNYLLDEKTFISGGATNNGGNVVEWLVKKFISEGGKNNYDAVFTCVNTISAGSEGLLFLPYLNGERAPIWDERSSGTYIGVRSIHHQEHFIKAALEGLCFALYDIFSSLEKEGKPVHQIKLSGGVAKSKIFAQLLADVTGKKIVWQDAGDASALGAAYLALKSEGIINNYAELSAKSLQTLSPNLEHHRTYQKLFVIYQTIYPTLRQAMLSLHPFHSTL